VRSSDQKWACSQKANESKFAGSISCPYNNSKYRSKA